MKRIIKRKLTQLKKKLATEREEKRRVKELRSEFIINRIENYPRTAFKEDNVFGNKSLACVVMPSDLVKRFRCRNCRTIIDHDGYCKQHQFISG